MQPNRQSAQDTEPLRRELATPAEDLHQDGTAYDAAEEVRPCKRRRTEDVMPERTTRSGRRTIVPHALIAAAANDEEPLTYKEAVEGPEGRQWLAAIIKELLSLKKLGVYTILRRGTGIRRNPAGKVIKSKATSAALKAASAIDKVIASKWVFKKKILHDGSFRYKARLVIRGDLQRDDVETYAPVAMSTTVRALLAIAAARDLEAEHMDVKTAFLYAGLKERVLMRAPQGSTDEGDTWLLNKALYGLKQAPRAWHAEIDKSLKRLGFTKSSADESLYLNNDGIYLLIYVDDLLLVGEKAKVDCIKKKLTKMYEMTDLGLVQRFLGITVERDRAKRTVKLHQQAYIEGLLRRYGYEDCNPVATPMVPGQALSSDDGKPLVDEEVTWYQQLVGSLMYAMTSTRPDLAFTMSKLSKFFDKPTEVHANAATQVLRYLKGTASRGITFNGTKKTFAGYSDADFAGDVDDRKSTGGYVFLLHGGAVSWKAKKQALPALSTVEAEYIAGAEATKKAIWLARLLHKDLNMQLDTTLLHFDNQGAMALASNNGNSHTRTKHIDVKWHFIRAYVENGTIKITYLPTASMVADILTKGLARDRHQEHMLAMGMHDK